jgi:uncharacterized membrane protein
MSPSGGVDSRFAAICHPGSVIRPGSGDFSAAIGSADSKEIPMPRRIFRTGPLPTSRVEAFSDSVLAVAITLLALEIKVPPGMKNETALWAAIHDLAPVMLAWAISFAFVLTFWVNHHYFFASLKNADRGLLWLNGFFLLTVTLIPFPAELIGQYPAFNGPLALLSGTMMLTSLSFMTMRLYVSYHGRLLRDNIDAARTRRAMIQSGIAPLMYAAATGLAFSWPPGAILIQIMVLIIFFLRSPAQNGVPDAA